MKILKPDLCVEGLSDIDLGYWYRRGIRCILVDLDNTISPWGTTMITEEAKDLVEKSRSVGISVILFTNAAEARAREIAWDVGISYYASAKKPLPFYYKKAITELSYADGEIMTVGDQIFTDVLGGNLNGCITVLTSPLSSEEFSGTKMLRLLEKLIVGRKIVFRDRLYSANGGSSVEHAFEKDGV